MIRIGTNKRFVLNDFEKLNNCLNKSYLFRTRLERCLIKAKTYGINNNFHAISESALNIQNKLLYICDASNVTTSGNTKSFELLKDEINDLKELIEESNI